MYFRYGFYSEAVISISHMDSLPVEQADTNSEEDVYKRQPDPYVPNVVRYQLRYIPIA